MTPTNPTLDQFNGRYSWRKILSFAALFVWESFTGRKLSRLMQCQIGKPQVEVYGEDNLPVDGVFTLAVNHFKNGQSLGVVSAVLTSAGERRPELKDKYLLVVGLRVSARARNNAMVRWISRSVAACIQRRWTKNLIHIPTENDPPSISYLRDSLKRVL